jgi:hypothetical protein
MKIRKLVRSLFVDGSRVNDPALAVPVLLDGPPAALAALLAAKLMEEAAELALAIRWGPQDAVLDEYVDVGDVMECIRDLGPHSDAAIRSAREAKSERRGRLSPFYTVEGPVRAGYEAVDVHGLPRFEAEVRAIGYGPAGR